MELSGISLFQIYIQPYSKMSEDTFVTGLLGGMITSAILGIVPALAVVLICILFDFGTGIWAAAKNGDKISSHKMRETVYKTLAYLSVIVLCALIDESISLEWHLATFTAGFCAVNELVSIIENWGRITGKDYLEKIKDFLKNKLDNQE